eukprot:jgi/Bigna1/82212/fgenesh1_pg.89_\
MKERYWGRRQKKSKGEPPMMQLLAAGAAGGVTTKTCVAPLERMKILFQVQGMEGTRNQPQFRSIPHAARHILRGMRVVPVYALKFGFNDTFKGIVKKPGQTQLSFYQLISSGTMAGLFQACITYPLELIRTRLTLGPAYGAQYKGIIDCVMLTYRHEGLSGFYKGLTPTIWSGAPYVGLQMSCYEIYTRNLGTRIKEKTGSSTLSKLMCGAISGITAQTLTYPGDTIRRRMQTDGMCGRSQIYKSMMDCYHQIVAKEGHLALFRGWGTNTIRAIPGAGIQFLAYDTFKALFVG